MTTLAATTQPLRYTVTGALDGESIHIEDITPVGNLTGVNPALTAISSDSEAGYLAALTDAAVTFDPLPDSGWLEAGRVYDHNGTLVMVRQSHYRTIYPPADTPALFVVYREDADDVLDWIAGESVIIGMRRIYEGIAYRCIQGHTTQIDYTPAATVGVLWALVTPPTPEWTVGVAYKGDNTQGAGNGDVVMYQGNEYRCLQSHTSIATWTPAAVPALWLRL